MNGFQAKNVAAIRSNRVVCVVKAGDLRAKVFQVVFGRDGSLFVSFPYFRDRIGILSSTSLPANGAGQQEINLEDGGKVTSHLVKYSHHASGLALFSQSKRIISAVRRQSVALDAQHGHIFSLSIQGLGALDAAHPVKDIARSAQRSVVDFEVDPTSNTILFVGRWLDVSRMRCSTPVKTIGPTIDTLEPDGVTTRAHFIANPEGNPSHVLAVSCIPIPSLGPQPEIFVFCGGFDPQEVMRDNSRQGGFLSFIYPVTAAEELRERVGSVDYVPKTGP
jgi:hypothetical protein